MIKIGNIEIIDDKGWNLFEKLPSQDWMAEEVDMKITSDFGIGIKARYDGENYTFMRNPRKKPTVTLVITTWRGISSDAIHYYGKLQVDLPEMCNDAKYGHTIMISGYGGIPMFSNDTIQLTHVLEQYEIDKYPDRYQYARPGYHVSGFYTVDAVIRRATEVFEKIFGEGWTLKIEKRF